MHFPIWQLTQLPNNPSFNGSSKRALGIQSASNTCFVMLRISIEEKTDSVLVRLEGRLIGSWVADVEQFWNNVFANFGDRSVQVDLSAVTFVDTSGGVLLKRMHDAGFRLEGGDPLLENARQVIEHPPGRSN
jgi:anti-anti-sigma regulatory factor